MMMYDTFTFTSVVAWAVFVATKLLLMIVVADAFLESEEARRLRELREKLEGKKTVIDWRKIAVLFVIWFVSGWYLFG